MSNPNGGVQKFKTAIKSGTLYNPVAFCVDPTGTWAYIACKGLVSYTTIAVGSNGATLPTTPISLTTTAGLNTNGGFLFITNTTPAIQQVFFTGVSGSTITGCTGGTGTLATGGVVTNPATIYQINLSTGAITNSGAVWHQNPNSAVTGYYQMAYDNANSQLVVLDQSGNVWGIPINAGSPPTAGTASQLFTVPTNFIAGANGAFFFDTTQGIMYQHAAGSHQPFGMAWGPPATTTGIQWGSGPLTTYTQGQAVTHPFTMYGGYASLHIQQYTFTMTYALRGGTQTIYVAGDNPGLTGVRFRSDTWQDDAIHDSQGLTNSTSNGATPGTAIATPQSATYDSVGRLYVYSVTGSTATLYAISQTDEATITTIGTIASISTPLLQSQYIASGGVTGGGEILVLDSQFFYDYA